MTTAAPASSYRPVPGDLIAGKYRVERVLGQGGMGIVYAAVHEVLGQRVAIKLLLNDVSASGEVAARFLNEARAAARIESDHVARVIDFGTLDGGVPFMVLEYLEGGDLAQRLARGPLPVVEAVDYVLQALEAIAQAHALGIVHRDLKPANLFLAQRADGSVRVKVLDFGISKSSNPMLAPGGELTSTRAMLGSPYYMSPEQLRSAKSVDARADVWACGVILYELLTGTPPFLGETLGELLVSIMESAPAPIRTRRPDVPEALEHVILRCLARDLGQRFADVGDLAVALAPFAPPERAASVERVHVSLRKPMSGARSGTSPIAQTMPLTPPPSTLPSAGSLPSAGTTAGAWGSASSARTSSGKLGLLVGVAVLVVGIGAVAIVGYLAFTTKKVDPTLASQVPSASSLGPPPPAPPPPALTVPPAPSAPPPPPAVSAAPVAATSAAPPSSAATTTTTKKSTRSSGAHTSGTHATTTTAHTATAAATSGASVPYDPTHDSRK